MPTAIVTGASKGLGRAVAEGLAATGWSLVIDARDPEPLEKAAASLRPALAPAARLRAIAGDVTDPEHLARLIGAARELGDLELVVNNASALGPSPLPALTDYPLAQFRRLLDTNTIAPLALVQAAAPQLDGAARPAVVNITSDASVEPYPGWGGYGAAKAALDQLGAVLGVERPAWRVWTVDPGDLRTQMHQDAFPGEDISDRPEPETVVPSFLALLDSDRPSGRLKLSDVGVLRPAGRAS
ncbi:MAG TPA: SDR family oxidoreductase [Acidimicrobiales bacterium]|nr:SDR family oxidoreductase [Acidimicrobiales bacterium]